MAKFLKITALVLALLTVFTACTPAAQAPEPAPTPAATPTPAPTPEPTPAPTPEPTEPPLATLLIGSEGDEVMELQHKLIDLGYLKAEKGTGYYGTETQAAVTSFQEHNGLTKSGTANETTRKLIASEEAIACPLPLAGYIIGLDPGHQTGGNFGKEPVAPGSTEMKMKVSTGTAGKYTRVWEYQVNLDVGLLLRDMLTEAGATVVMTRETNEVDITNIERAQFFNDNMTDYALRLHCNGSEDTSIHGAFMLVPTENPFYDDCVLAAELLIDEFCSETGARNMGLYYRDDQTGFNWCERMVINIEMGHMSNYEEDHKLTDSAYQQKMAQGIFNGILKYFEQKEAISQ